LYALRIEIDEQPLSAHPFGAFSVGEFVDVKPIAIREVQEQALIFTHQQTTTYGQRLRART
jgi:hypothetical protein